MPPLKRRGRVSRGEGFAVVADGAQPGQAQESTQDIYAIVQELSVRAMDAVQKGQSGTFRRGGSPGLERVVESGTMLHGITDAISQIAHMSTQMAASVEQQTQVAKKHQWANH